MTILELLIASVLVTLLVAALTGLLRTMTLARQTIEDKVPDQSWQENLLVQLVCDVRQARQVDYRPGSLTLVGNAGRDFDSGAVTHERTEVTWFLQPLGKQSLLLRREAILDSLSNQNFQIRVAGVDVATFEVAQAEPGELFSSTSGTESWQGPPPAGLHVAIGMIDKNIMRFERTFLLR